jgi:hypothetical protein
LGDIAIITGDIETSTEVINDPINQNYIAICTDCDDPNTPNPPDPTDPPDPQPPVDPNPPNTDNGGGTGGNSGSSNNSDSGTGGSVLGASTGSILPATGNSQQLWLLIANILTFLLGCYLRLRSGRSPAVVNEK